MNLSRIIQAALTGILSLIISFGVISCNSSENKGKEERVQVAVVTNNPEEFWSIAEVGAKKAGSDFNVDVIFRKPEKGDVAVQMDIVNTVVQTGVSGVAISVISPADQTTDLKQIAKKANLITMDNDAPNSERICYVGTDNYLAGKAVGKLVKEVIPEGGDIAIFVGQITPDNAKQRFQGVVDELADQKDAKGPQYGKYKLYRGEAITDGANPEEAQIQAGNALEALKDQPSIAMVGLWAYNTPAILEAARAKKLTGKVKIVGFDEYTQTLNGIEAGDVYATVVQDPYNFGYKSVEILAAEARGDKSKRAKTAVPHRIITKTGIDPETKKKDRLTVKEFQDNVNKLLGK